MKARTTLRLLAAAVTVSALAIGTPAHAAPQPDSNVAPAYVAYLIVNHRSGMCLAPNGPFANAGIAQVPCQPWNTQQQWNRIDRGDGIYLWLVNVAYGFCWDLVANSVPEVRPGTLVQQFWCNPEWTSEDWRTEPSNRFLHDLIRTKINSLCAQVENKSTAPNARLRLAGCSYSESSQQFQFVAV
ncbi:hypothetical protein Rhe02_03210 [Rhizocola hellebori]|uniref:Ricin B lectin domain-containing protein n=1 Tax=Rhizocola hellebori TaxID=1392758 RepID=A0A8J3Q2H5_9ACTN|nr:RICIN domain-containing protein [Rhizocola hellebori]GIH02254.1 hypothetical protein Rhe02_03210 [Rhizocola hellebori]